MPLKEHQLKLEIHPILVLKREKEGAMPVSGQRTLLMMNKVEQQGQYRPKAASQGSHGGHTEENPRDKIEQGKSPEILSQIPKHRLSQRRDLMAVDRTSLRMMQGKSPETLGQIPQQMLSQRRDLVEIMVDRLNYLKKKFQRCPRHKKVAPNRQQK